MNSVICGKRKPCGLHDGELLDPTARLQHWRGVPGNIALQAASVLAFSISDTFLPGTVLT
ncbi:MAG: hypothetical protein ABI790_09480 [Betaproteobacteria bacterium]